MDGCDEIEKTALAASLFIGVSVAGLLGACAHARTRGEMQAPMHSTIAFVSTRHDPTFPPGLNAFPNWGEVRERSPAK